MVYCGRFAPSPSGRLHLGSLISGYAAYFRAKEQHGIFLVRLEDLDFPRCPRNNIPLIQQELFLLGLHSDEPILLQGEHLPFYNEYLFKLINQKQAFYCSCTRKSLKEHPCSCQKLNIALDNTQHHAIRINLAKELSQLHAFTDQNLGLIKKDTLPQALPQSLVLQRADKIIAYNLAVVLDDHRQHISEVVRGADLLDATFLQLALYQALGFTPPKFLHIPLITTPDGAKLSKQNHAKAALSYLTPRAALIFCFIILQSKSNASKLMSILSVLAHSYKYPLSQINELFINSLLYTELPQDTFNLLQNKHASLLELERNIFLAISEASLHTRSKLKMPSTELNLFTLFNSCLLYSNQDTPQASLFSSFESTPNIALYPCMTKSKQEVINATTQTLSYLELVSVLCNKNHIQNSLKLDLALEMQKYLALFTELKDLCCQCFDHRKLPNNNLIML